MKSPLARLAVVSAVGLVVLASLRFARRDGEEWSLAQRVAMQRVVEAQRILARTRAEEAGAEALAELKMSDAAGSGLVGVEWSYLVSTAGSLDAKVASTDPRWAALFVSWFEEAGAGPERPVAIGSSASFPALLLSARIAAEVVGAEPVIAASLTASNSGATIPEFDLWRMEEVLLANDLVEVPIRLLTPGGDGDRLGGFEDGDAERILRRLGEIRERPRAPEIATPPDIAESVRLREDALLSPDTAIFVNIGGHAANYGTGAAALALPHGIIDPEAFALSESDGESVAFGALRRGVPVLNVVNVRSVMLEAGLDPAAPADRGAAPPHSWPARAVSLAAFAFLAAILVRGRARRPDRA